MAATYKTEVMTENDQVIIDIDDNIFFVTVREIEWISAQATEGTILFESFGFDNKWQPLSGGIYDLSYPGQQANPVEAGEIIRKVRITSIGLTEGARFSVKLITKFENPFTSRNLIKSAAGLLRQGVQSLDYRDDLVARGYGFFTFWERSDEIGGNPVPIGGNAYAYFTTPPDRYVLLSYRLVTTNQERIFYRVYTNVEPTQLTFGDDIRIGKLKYDSAITTGCTFKEVTNTTVDLTGAIKVVNVPVFGATGSAAKNNSGDLSPDSVFRTLPPNSEFLLVVENESELASYVQIDLVWAELNETLILDGGFG